MSRFSGCDCPRALGFQLSAGQSRASSSFELFSRAEQIRRAADAEMFVAGAGMLSPSISLGGAAIGASTAGLRPEALLSQADVALYRAKTEGRNRVVIARSEAHAAPAVVAGGSSAAEQGTPSALTF